jgi:Cu+-exporting ATPase
MDPDVVSDRPGPCPKCGMALEPAAPTADESPDPELVGMTWRLRLGLALAVPLIALAMLDMFAPGSPVSAAMGHVPFLVLQAVLCTPVVLVCGRPFFERFATSVRTLRPNMFTLIGLGVAASYLYSLFALADALARGHAHYHPYFESAAGIVVLVLVGQVLELRARRRTGDAVRALLRHAPRTARVVLPDGREEDLPVELVAVGDRTRVRPGERFPVDAVVREGTTTADESMLTGEPMPVDKPAGAAVMAGTLNGLGSVVAEATRVGSDTLLSQIVQLVGEAQRSRMPVQRLVDRVSAWFVPAVIVAAVLTFVGWAALGSGPERFTYGLVCAVSVLVIACPCALGLATPMAVVVGTGRAARAGILFRDAAALETMARVDTVVFDKTGTLTEGKPRGVGITLLTGHKHDTVALAAAVERHSEHPIARAVVEYALEGKDPSTLPPAEGVEVVPGLGVKGTVFGRVVLVGKWDFLRANGVTGDPPRSLAEFGWTQVFVAVDGIAEACIEITDELRPTAAEAVRPLAGLGLRLVLLTGDRKTTAEEVAARVGIPEVIGETLPADKHKAIERLKAEGRVVAMVGDGINDAPALAAADVGIAMGTGTDVAIASAGVTLVRPDLRAVAVARDISRATVRTIRQNLALAFGYNLLAVPVAAGAFGTAALGPVWAAAAMSLSSLSVVANSLRLARR